MTAAEVNAVVGATLTVSPGPLALIRSVVEQVLAEVDLDRTADVEHLALIIYVGLLEAEPPAPMTRERLLGRFRRQLVVWAWEQGRAGDPLDAEPQSAS